MFEKIKRFFRRFSRKQRFAEAIRKAFIETINEHPEYQGLPEDFKILKVNMDIDFNKYKRKE